jgi:hypothetical protein
MTPTWSCDLAIAPQGALERIATRINRRGRRAFGVLKTANEYVGYVGQRDFEIWERQKRAIHAKGHVAPVRGGARLEVEFVLPTRTRVLTVVFYALYALAALGIATQQPDSAVSLSEIAISLGGAMLVTGVFALGAKSQRTDLRAFLEGLFADVRS